MKAAHKSGIDVVDVQNLIILKRTRRIRDHSIIGALAEALGLNAGVPVSRKPV